MRKITQILGTLTAGSAVLVAGLVSATPAQASYVNDNTSQTASDILTHLNKFRASKKLAPVKYSITMSKVSNDWSRHLARTTSFYHNPKAFSDKRYVTGWNAGGEIIAARWDTSGKGLVNQWINSPPHRSIMLTKNLNTVGIGTARGAGKSYTVYGTVNFLGYHKNHSANKISGAYVVKNAIGTKWKSKGSYYSALGYPVTAEHGLSRDKGTYQRFENGSIHWSKKSGAHVTSGAISKAWGKQGYQNGRLGYPTSDEYKKGSVTQQNYQGGTIAWSPGKNAKVTYKK